MTWRLAILTAATLAIASISMTGCEKDDRQVAELVSHLQNAREWWYDAEARKSHVPWLQANIAWDILGAQTMMSAGLDDVGSDELFSSLDEILKSGLGELAAGPTPYEIAGRLPGWRTELGKGTCKVAELANDDAAWLKGQLTLAPPKGAAAAPRAALEGYAERARRACTLQRESRAAARQHSLSASSTTSSCR